MPQTLLNKVAVITGAGSGIGRATAELFLHEGAKVVLVGRSPAPLEEVTALAPARALAVAGDVTNVDDLNRLVAAVTRRFGQVDVLVTAAGIARVSPLIETEAADVDEQLQTNFNGTLNTIRRFAAALSRPASVICLSGRLPDDCGFGAFNASKAAVTALMRAFAVELAPRQVRVNCISPGATETPLWQSIGLTKSRTAKLLARLKNRAPAGELGTPQDVAEVALFLASEAAGHINGQEIVVDGGAQSTR